MSKIIACFLLAATGACSPSDVLARQGSSIRSTDFVQTAVDEKRKSDDAQAQKDLEKARAQAEIDKHVKAAQAHVDLFEYSAAVSEWKEAYRLSTDPVYLLRIAESARATGDCGETQRMYESYLEKKKDGADTDAVQGKIKEAKQCTTRAGVNVDVVRQHYQDGSTHYELSEYDAAIKDFKEAYRLSNDPAYLFNLAQSYRLKRDCGEAMRYYQRYLTAAGELPNKDKVQARIDEMKACAR